MNPGNGGWLILLTLLLALLLAIAHMPHWLPGWTGWLRPAWVVSVLFFWTIHAPHRLGLIALWLFGLLLDVLLSEPLGLNGVTLALVTFVGWQLYERLRMYSLVQHALVLFVLVIIAELWRALVLHWVLGVPLSAGLLVTPFISALCWPLVYGALVRVTRNIAVD